MEETGTYKVSVSSYQNTQCDTTEYNILSPWKCVPIAEHTPQVKGTYMQQAKRPRLREAFYYTRNQNPHTHLPLDSESPLSLISLKHLGHWNVSEINGIYPEVSKIKYNTTFCRMVCVLENLEIYFCFIM
jgi:hypothetical protein